MIDPVPSLPPSYEPFGPRRVEPVAPPEPTRDATLRCVCPADLLEDLPGSKPFDTHLRIENARADLIRRAAADRPAHARTPAQTHRSSDLPRLGGVSKVQHDDIQRRLMLTYRIERAFRAGVVIDIIA